MNPLHETHRSCKKFLRPCVLSLALAACFAANPVFALPVGAQVVAGGATLNQAGNTLTVANTPGAIINWSNFSVGALESVRFQQQSALSSVLNRVTGSEASAIYGALSSNGRVWLINPNGILFGAGARIDIPGFVASTLNISDADFLAGRMNFNAGALAGSIRNDGTLSNSGSGNIYLIAPDISNTGLINAPNGEVLLAAGRQVSLVDNGHPDVQVVVSAPTDQVVNLGQIVTQNGRVSLFGAILQQKGLISADRAEVDDAGRIVFRGTQSVTLDAGSVTTANGTDSAGGSISVRSQGDTYVKGTVSATGAGLAGAGGHIEALGARVAVMDQAVVDASGTTGGGNILIGGDYQGGNPDVPNADVTYFGPDASLKADATKVGAGGTVIVWADDTARAYGAISARGGAAGGDGGFVETSGHRHLDVNGIRVDTSTSGGNSGTWLLDPDSITVVQGGTDTLGSWVAPGVFESGGGDATLSWTTVNDNLSSSNVKLQTGASGSGDITFSPGTYASSYGNTLSLWAYGGGTSTGDIYFNGAYLTLAGGLEMVGGWNGTSASYSVLPDRGNITMSNSQITAAGRISLYGHNFTLTDLRSTQNNVVLNATGDVLLASSFTGYYDDYSFVYNLPFAFTYFGTRYTQAYISTNGLVTFGGGTYQYTDSVSGLATLTSDSTGVPLAVIAPAWNDWILRASTGKDVLIKQPSNNSLAVQWNVAKYANESVMANFETVLYRTGDIQFNYGAANASFAGDVTIGLANGTTAIQSQLMSRPNFSMNNLVSTRFSPAGSSYSETVSATATPLANMSGAVSGGRLLESTYASTAGGIYAALGDVSITAGGSITGYTGVEANRLSTVSGSGMILAGNSVGSFSAVNSGSGDISFSNNQTLTITGISNSGSGNVAVENFGGITVAGSISSGSAVTLTAHSPITINSGASITAVNDITLTADSTGSTSTTDMLTVNGSLASSAGSIGLSGGSGVAIGGTASLSAPAGSIQAASPFGSVTVDPLATINTPNFLINGVVTGTTAPVSTVATQVLPVEQTIFVDTQPVVVEAVYDPLQPEELVATNEESNEEQRTTAVVPSTPTGSISNAKPNYCN